MALFVHHVPASILMQEMSTNAWKSIRIGQNAEADDE